MPGSFAFYKDSSKTAAKEADLSDAKVMIYKDGGKNEYILDASGVVGLSKIDDLKLSNLKDIKIKYQPKDGRLEEVEGLGNIIGKLFATKSASNSKTVLAEEVAKKPVVDAILSTKEKANDTESIFAKEIAKKVDVTGAILGAIESTDAGQKSILVEKLGTFLPGTDAVYGNSNPKKAAGDFLAGKGLKPTPAELAEDNTFVSAVRVAVNAKEIREAMSQPVFEIPADENAPLSWDW